MTDPAPRAEILSVGSELLAGSTVDTNEAFLAGELTRVGFAVVGARQLPDDRAVLADAFRSARARSALVLVTGGLGPTHDDLTRESLADALGEALTEDPELVERLRRRFRAYGPMPAANLRQARVIPSAQVLENPIGSAPGWWVDRDDCVVVLMPGVPSEMRRMWTDALAPRLPSRFELRPLHVRTVRTFGVGESAVADRLGELLESPPPGVETGIYARDDGVHLRFQTRGDAASLAPLVESALAALGDGAYGVDHETLPVAALAALHRAGVRTIATVELGTEGALGAILSGVLPAEGCARFAGGLLLPDAAGRSQPAAAELAPSPSLTPPAPPEAEATLRLVLHDADEHGRSQVEVSLEGSAGLDFSAERVRIHGSGPQRLRRAAFAALDQLRRRLT